MAGVSYERLERYRSLHWPVAEDGSDQPLLYTEQFKFPDGKARFFPVEWTEPTDQQDAEYDLHLNNGRLLEHFHEGNMTYCSDGIREKTPCTFVEVSPELAKDRGIEDGSWVQLSSRYGKVRVQAVVTARVHGKELYMPMNSVNEPVNRLTSSHTDAITHTPAYKEALVHLEILNQAGENPLPRTNSRFGQPTPQAGVEVERKWKRADYREPGHALSTRHPPVRIRRSKLARLNELEQAGLFDKGAPWERGHVIQPSTRPSPGAWGYFHFLYGARPDSSYDPSQRQRPLQLGALPRNVGLPRRVHHRRQPQIRRVGRPPAHHPCPHPDSSEFPDHECHLRQSKGLGLFF